jgi:hypothetical protein
MATTHEIADLSGVEHIREGTRQYLALIAIGGFFLIVFAVVMFTVIHEVVNKTLTVDGFATILSTAAGVLGGIVGAVVGFYFRTEYRLGGG